MSLPFPVERLPPWVARLVRWLETRWLGRVGLRTMRSSIRIELFDRSMTIAAQLFTGDALPSDARMSLAVEPMSAPADAFNSGEGLTVLGPAGDPDDEHSCSWGIRAL